jgi:predicted dienelactone hydrolase
MNISRFMLFLSVFASGASSAQELISLARQDKHNVPVQVYKPNKPCVATAIISHGAGGSQNGYEYLAEFLRQQQFLVLVLGHQESGSAVLGPMMLEKGLISAIGALVTTPSAYQARFMDISAAKAWAKDKCSTPFIVLAGHSMGAATAMIEAGAKNKLGLTGADGFDAYVAMSPQGVGTIFIEDAWKGIKKPVLLLTGTKDNELNGTWETRKDAFASLPVGCKWLGVIDDATHMSFAQRSFSGKTEDLVSKTTLAFLNGVAAKNCVMPEPLKGMSLQVK